MILQQHLAAPEDNPIFTQKACLIVICTVQCMKFDCEKINLMSSAQTQTDLVSEGNNKANVAL